VTIRDVAISAGVSPATASRALHHDTRITPATTAKVESAAVALDYRPDVRARQIRLVDTRLIGLVTHSGQDHHNSLANAIREAARANGYDLLPAPATMPYLEIGCSDMLISKRVRGLILVDPRAAETLLQEISERLPTVVIGAPHPGLPGVDQVYSSNSEGFDQACAALREYRHRRLLALNGPPGASASKRLEQISVAAQRYGLDLTVVSAGDSESAGSDAVNQALASGLLGPPGGASCVVAYNDQCGLGALIAMLRKGLRVPEDISLIGVDGSERAASSGIELATVDKQLDRMAAVAVELLVERMGQASDVKTRRKGRLVGVKSQLCLRQSLGSSPAWAVAGGVLRDTA
jgi:LacI family transcriptional regulator